VVGYPTLPLELVGHAIMPSISRWVRSPISQYSLTFQVVLASGNLANINTTSSPDLFRALKGGGNNFGIVTRFDLAVFPQGLVLGGNIAQDISYRGEVFKAFANIANAPEYDPYASLVTGLTFNATGRLWSIATTAIYTKPVMNPEIYEELLNIPTTTNTLHLTNLSILAAEGAPPPLNWVFYTGTYGVSAELLSRIFDRLNGSLYDFDIGGGIFWSVAFEPLPTAITKWGELKGGNSLGTEPMDGNAFGKQTLSICRSLFNIRANMKDSNHFATCFESLAPRHRFKFGCRLIPYFPLLTFESFKRLERFKIKSSRS
jgi:hypothetical protein